MSGHILILFVSVLVAVSAVLSALGFKGRVEVIGVDLGTTYSVAAVSEKGRVRVFEDPVRGKLTASTVAFLQDGTPIALEISTTGEFGTYRAFEEVWQGAGKLVTCSS